MNAKEFAIAAHGEQKYGDLPYSYHLEKVAEALERFGYNDPELISAAWLHDVVEDTDTTIEEVRKEFGDRVAELVFAVTNEPGINRKERHSKTYIKIKKLSDAIVLKLADRIANTESSIETKSKLLGMYKKEFPHFKEALKGTQALEMWDYLESISK